MKLYKKNKEEKRIHLDFTFEVKQISEDDEFFYFEGYGSTFDDIDRVDDVMVRGCFSESLRKQIPALLWQHQMDMPLGIYISAEEDVKGLFLKGKMPKEDDFVRGRVIPQMKVGSIRKMSIGFTIPTKDDFYFKDGIRYIKRANLWEVSLVTIPANNNADVVAMKNLKMLNINGKQLSFSDIAQMVRQQIMMEYEGRDVYIYIYDIYPDNVIYEVESEDGEQLYRQNYTLNSDSETVTLTGDPVMVMRTVNYIEVQTADESRNEINSVQARHFNINSVIDIKTKRQFEECLRESGMFTKSSRTYLSSFFQESRSDSGQKNEKSNLSAILTELKQFNSDLENM